jgi:hypothetical protein
MTSQARISHDEKPLFVLGPAQSFFTVRREFSILGATRVESSSRTHSAFTPSNEQNRSPE